MEITYLTDNYDTKLSSDEKRLLINQISENLNIVSVCKCQFKDFLSVEYSTDYEVVCSIIINENDFNKIPKLKHFISYENIYNYVKTFLFNDVIVKFYLQKFSLLGLLFKTTTNNNFFTQKSTIQQLKYRVEEKSLGLIYKTSYYEVIDIQSGCLLLAEQCGLLFPGIISNLLNLSSIKNSKTNINGWDNLSNILEMIIGCPVSIDPLNFRENMTDDMINKINRCESTFLTDKMICRLDNKLFEYNDLFNFYFGH